MKRLHFFLPVMAIAFALCCTSCSKDDDEDDEIIPVNIDGWESARYSSCKIDGLEYIEVPAEGGTFGFRCSEDVAVKLTDHAFCNYKYDNRNQTIYDKTRDSTLYKNEWCETKVKGDSLILVFKPNDSDFRRKANIGVRYGNEDACFRFVQKTKIGINSDLVGDWVSISEYSKAMFGRFRYTFNDDGTCWMRWESFRDPAIGNSSFMKAYNWNKERAWASFEVSKDYDFDCTYALNGDRLTLKTVNGGVEIPLVRLASSKESVAPKYELVIVPTKSASSTFVLPGEKYSLNCKIQSAGNYFEMDSIRLQRTIYYVSGTYVCDTIDLSEYASKRYVFSMEFEMPANVVRVEYELESYARFLYDEMMRGEGCNVATWVRNKKVYLEENKK